MKSLLIVYHSQSGACATLARAAWDGARREESVATRALRAWDAGLRELREADGLLLVAAENSATVSGGMKDFLDRTFYPAIDAGIVLPCALLLSAGNDGRGARTQVERILSGYPFPLATETQICRGEVTEAHRQVARDTGQALAAGIDLGIF